MEVDGHSLERLVGGKCRLISIDGGQTAEITAHDLETAEMALARGGVIILHDCFHEGWPGVSDGVHSYFLRSRGIVLFATGGNKTLFCAPQYAPGYTAALLPVGIKVRRQTFLGRSVVYLDFIPFNCAERIGSTEAWKAVKNVPPLPALRRMYRQRVIW